MPAYILEPSGKLVVLDDLDSYETHMRPILIDMERRNALAHGRPFDPDDREMLARIDLELVEGMDDCQLFDGPMLEAPNEAESV